MTGETMKILIVSDTHGRHRNLEEVLDREGPIDMLVHLGDVEGGEDYICALADCETHIIAGNNDFFSNLSREQEFFIGKYRVFITHGHSYYVSMGTKELKKEARRRGVDIVMYGHTHVPHLEVDGNLTVLNPGSLSYPRQADRRAGYMIMEIDHNGKAHFEQCFV